MDALLAFILRLLNDPAAREEFNSDPEGAMAAAGLGDVSCDDVDAVLPVVYDSVGVSQDRDYDTSAHVATGASGGNFYDGGGHKGHDGGGHKDHDGGKHAVSDDPAVQQISNVVNKTTVYDNDTIYDNSINQNFVATDGGKLFVDQDIDQTSANGDGAVAVGGDNEGAISTGGGVTAGDDIDVEDSVLVGGDNSGDVINGDDNVVQGDDSNNADRGGEIDNSTEIEDSFNTDNSTDNSTEIEDSFNTDNSTDVDVEETNIDAEFEDNSVSETGPGSVVQGDQSTGDNTESIVDNDDVEQEGLINVNDVLSPNANVPVDATVDVL